MHDVMRTLLEHHCTNPHIEMVQEPHVVLQDNRYFIPRDVKLEFLHFYGNNLLG